MEVIKYIMPTKCTALDFAQAIRNSGGSAVVIPDSRCVLSDYPFKQPTDFMCISQEASDWDFNYFNENKGN